jgi:deazaflavin-dependent oxidoreductase (nitroreductase family)
MATTTARPVRVPGFVDVFNPLARRLLHLGVPMGPNALLTVRGRKSGEPRTTPVALVEIGGRRWIIGTFGEVNWVRNLRAAGQASVTVGRKTQAVAATELTTDEAAAFFNRVLGPYVRSLPLGKWLLGSVLGAREILEDPTRAALEHPVFELRQAA